MKQKKYLSLAYRFLFWTASQFLIASGIVFSVKSELGVFAGSSVPYVVSETLGLSLGHCVTGFFCILVVLQILLLKKEFEIKNLVQVFGATIFGVFTNAATFLFDSFTADTYWGRLLFLFLGIVLQAVGIALYVDTNIILMPAEGIITATHKKLLSKFSLGTAKVIVDCTWLVIAAVLFMIFRGKLIGIREGTLILALTVGKVMGYIYNRVKEPLNRMFYGLVQHAG